MTEPAIYTGTVRHRRFRPTAHEFSYRVFMAYLDIDRIPETMAAGLTTSYNRFNWASFYDRDHFGDPTLSLRERLTRDAAANGIALPDGQIFLLTNLRYLGYTFNPISLFYCFDRAGQVRAVLAEVNSTFGERHNYWLTGLRQRSHKEMHVSPFMGMQLEYEFSLSQPAASLAAHLECLDGGEGRFFDATLALERRPWGALNGCLAKHPWMTAKVIAAIHWEALRLYLKGTPFYARPKPAA